MQGTLENAAGWRSTPWRVAAWSSAIGIMLVPILAQLITGPFGWSTGDFVFLDVLVFTSCFIFDVAARKARNLTYLAGAGAALATGFGLVIVNSAVGRVGSENEIHNLLFSAPILVAIIGAAVSRGRAQGMARTMFAAAVAHLIVSAALLAGAGGVSDGHPLTEVAGLAVFAAMWLASAWLFQRAATPHSAR